MEIETTYHLMKYDCTTIGPAWRIEAIAALPWKSAIAPHYRANGWEYLAAVTRLNGEAVGAARVALLRETTSPRDERPYTLWLEPIGPPSVFRGVDGDPETRYNAETG